jgi:predicted Rossmann fold flavoprotein
MRRLGIIGAGPAGLMAALEASRFGMEVHLFDSNPRVGRKLKGTGAGRCNISNQGAAAQRYSGGDPDFLHKIFSAFSQSQLASSLDSIGIPIYATPDGWCYPLSESAINVVDILEAHLRKDGVRIYNKTKICDIQHQNSDFLLAEANAKLTYSFERIVCATGGKAFPKLGSNGEFFSCLKRLGHTIVPVFPALAPLLTDPKPIHKLQGIRMDVGVRLFRDLELLGDTTGNIIFNEWGINGPGVMDLSHLVSTNQNSALHIEINFLPFHEELLQEIIKTNRASSIALQVIFQAILPLKVVLFFMEQAGLSQEIQINRVPDESLEYLFNLIKKFPLEVRGTRGFDFCQISTGGVPLAEIFPVSLESRLHPGLFFAGEVMDVIGPCGGYNLHWALSSGVLAGRAAARL